MDNGCELIEVEHRILQRKSLRLDTDGDVADAVDKGEQLVQCEHVISFRQWPR